MRDVSAILRPTIRGVRPRRATSALLLAAQLALVSACQHTPGRPVSIPTTPASCPGAASYLVAAGVDENNASLYEVNGCDGSARIVKWVGRVSALATGPESAAVSAAPTDVDQVYRLVGDHLVGLTEGHAPNGSSPAVSVDGKRVAYISLGPPGPRPFLVVEVPVHGRAVVVFRNARPLGAISYGPSGDLFVARNAEGGLPGQGASGTTADLWRVRGGSGALVSRLPYPFVTGLAVSSEQFAVSGPDGLPGMVLNKSGHATGAFRPGLRVQTFVSQGRRLLVVNGKRFGMLTMPTSTAQAPVWMPFKIDATVVSVRPR